MNELATTTSNKDEVSGVEIKNGVASDVESLWYTRCPIPTATSLAIATGSLDRTFAPFGITIRSLRASCDRSVRESHFDHNVHHSFRHGGNTPPLWTRARGGDTHCVALSWVDEYQAVVALPESGIRTAKDLEGRRLGVPARTHDQIDFFRGMCLRGYRTALNLVELDFNDVTLVELPIQERYLSLDPGGATENLWGGAYRARRQQAETFALIRGEIDALFTAGGAGAQLAAQLGAQEVESFGFGTDSSVRISNQTPAVVSVGGPLVRERPDVVALYLAELLKAGKWAQTHKEETRAIIAREVGISEEWVEPGYGADFNDQLVPGLRAEWIDALADQKNFLLANGFIDADFDLEDWIDPAPLEAAQKLLEKS